MQIVVNDFRTLTRRPVREPIGDGMRATAPARPERDRPGRAVARRLAERRRHAARHDAARRVPPGGRQARPRALDRDGCDARDAAGQAGAARPRRARRDPLPDERARVGRRMAASSATPATSGSTSGRWRSSSRSCSRTTARSAASSRCRDEAARRRPDHGHRAWSRSRRCSPCASARARRWTCAAPRASSRSTRAGTWRSAPRPGPIEVLKDDFRGLAGVRPPGRGLGAALAAAAGRRRRSARRARGHAGPLQPQQPRQCRTRDRRGQRSSASRGCSSWSAPSRAGPAIMADWIDEDTATQTFRKAPRTAPTFRRTRPIAQPTDWSRPRPR